MDINDSVFFGLTPLSIAAGAGQSKMLKFLLEQGADVNARNQDGGTALHGAAFLGHSKSVQLLIENGINIMAQNSRGITAADLAKMDWSSTEFIGQYLQIKLNRSEIDKGRTQVAQFLD